MDQRKRLVALRQDWIQCTRCALHEQRYNDRGNIVFGAGSPGATFFFLYDVPAEEDEAVGSPMSGDHGKMLLDLMGHAKIDNKLAYCAPLLGCRPKMIIPATDDAVERVVDKAPLKEEIVACTPRVLELLYVVDPQVIFAVGDLAWKFLVKPKDRGIQGTLDKARGDIFVHRRAGIYHHEITYPVIPILGMKQLFQNPSNSATGPLTLAIRDLTKGRMHVEYVKAAADKDQKGSAGTP